MRGLTMMLVVYSHVANLVVKNNTLTWDPPTSWIFNSIFVEFRMPLFFFVSGFVLFKASRVWDVKEILAFFKKKLPVQLVFPLICLAACLAITHIDSFPNAFFLPLKDGYWFTFVLLEFYVFYVLLQLLPFKGKAADVVEVLAGVVAFTGIWCAHHFNPNFLESRGMVGLFSVPEWNYFFYFIFGVQARKHFLAFEKVLDNSAFMTLCLVAFIGVNIAGRLLAVAGILGVVLVFSFFRRYQQNFTKESRLGRTMQYVGRHTLDIYLLHYFFIYTNDWSKYKSFLEDLPLLELGCSLVISVLIIALCLIVSNFLRLSPFIARYCFGSKKLVRG